MFSSHNSLASEEHILYHGTSWENAKRIAQNGFQPSREEGSYPIFRHNGDYHGYW